MLAVVLAFGAPTVAGATGPDRLLFEGHDGSTVDASGNSTDTGGQVVVGSSGPGQPGVGAGEDPCSYTVGPAEVIEAVIGSSLPGSPSGSRDDPDDDAPVVLVELPWVLVQCPTSYSGGAIVDIFQVGEPPPATAMLEAAQRALWIPLPDVTFSPSADAFQVVGIETWLWMGAEHTSPLLATACIPPDTYACATVVAVFDTVTVDMGDGSDVVDCEGPGRAFDIRRTWEDQLDVDNCGHVYVEPADDGADYPVTATSRWSLTWSCLYDADFDGRLERSCGGGPVGVVGRVAASVPLEVRQYQAVATVGG